MTPSIDHGEELYHMDSDADAVVIGSGALGLSTAYHLAKLGLEHVVVVDRCAPASQTSPRAAGLFKLIQPDETRTLLSRLSIDKVLRFEEDTGVPLAVARSGSIMLARTAEHAALIEEDVERSRSWGIDVELIDPVEAHRLMPVLEAQGVRAACYTRGDVYIEEPSSLLNAYLEASARLGVRVVAHTAVTGVRLRAGEVAGVETNGGRIMAPVVVDAAGAWARLVGRMAGIAIPVAPVRHQLFITDPIAGVDSAQPILRITDTAVYIRPARGGLMLGGFEHDPLSLDPGTRSDGFSIDDVPLNMGVLEGLAGTVRDQVPALRDAEIQEHRGGLFTMTPDGRFVVGPVPGAAGLWSATGCNGSGFSSSPAIGQLLAEWIVEGEPSIDLDILRPGRFDALDEARLRDAGVWQYAHYYDPHASRPA